MTEVTDRIDEARLRRFRPYPAYRDSGVEWLGEVPEHWVTCKATHGFRRIGSGTTPKSDDPEYYDGDISWVTTSELRETVIVDTTKKVTTTAMREYPTLRMYPKGTLLFAMYGATIGRLGILGIAATVNQACAALAEPLHLATWFVYYWLQMRRPTLTVLSAGGGQPNLSQDDLRQLRIPAPPLDEQRAIAAFLDRETAKIDGLVARKERLIELLQEKRAVLITRAVTRGLDPDVPIKDSGVEWLGEIPAHWEVMPLKRLLSRCDYGISENLGGSGDIRVLTMAHIQQGEVELPDDGSISSVDRTMVLEFGDLLFNRTNSRELVGKVGMFRGNQGDHVTFASYLVRLTAREGVEPEWLNYLLNSSGVLGMARSMALLSVNQANLNPTKYKQIVVPTPVLSEQQTIAGYLRCETTKIDALIAKVRQAIDHLKEFRTALISAAVTGKIDVREEVS